MPGQSHFDIIIVGGGAAGLSAAVTAEQKGLRCQLLEAQDRLGGRIHSVCMNGMWVDLGAQLINGDMSHVLSIAKQAGLYLSPIPSTGAFMTVNADGKPLRDYRPQDRNWMKILATAPLPQLIANRENAPSLAEIIDELQLDAEQRTLAKSLMTELFGQSPEKLNGISVVHDLNTFESKRAEAEFQLREGFAGIIHHMASLLHHTPRLNTPVTRIVEQQDGVRVETPNGSYQAKNAIVAVPPSTAQKIVFCTPHDDAGLARLLSSFIPGDLIKFILTFEHPFWRHQGLSGYAEFHSPCGLSVVDASLDDGSHPRLVAFMGGPMAREWAHTAPSSRHKALLTELEKAFGSVVSGTLKDIYESDWLDHPWCGGAYNAHVRLSGISDAPEHLAQWGTRVRFACAEIAGLYRGYVEGALISGDATVRHLLQH